MKFQRIALAIALAASIGAVAAQQQPAQPQQSAQQQQPPQLSPEQQQQLQRQDAEMTRAAQQVVQMIDANRVGEVWDMSTEQVKRMVPRDSFVQQITADRARLGAPATRGNAVVSRSQFQAGGEVPEGLYINVAFPTTFANNAEPVRELVSFRLDEDRVWRVSGYSLR
ncbi:DUF4019 domain-containing protein [Luteimonas sp. RD2P54]|uniref:DUF4019 domain-containing protein n=1 Tax=Luteimonas endophytica TaxID=3042023 RepID=A0ABT6JB52_9GAMM|nr:DUF4019 domain-containing protein [Luteimonas endophytica]MDH5824058.1 DUF4019 domain-containing protein [Luteimonas endophytica]